MQHKKNSQTKQKKCTHTQNIQNNKKKVKAQHKTNHFFKIKTLKNNKNN